MSDLPKINMIRCTDLQLQEMVLRPPCAALSRSDTDEVDAYLDRLDSSLQCGASLGLLAESSTG